MGVMLRRKRGPGGGDGGGCVTNTELALDAVKLEANGHGHVK